MNGTSGIWPPITFTWNAATNAQRYEVRAWYNLTTGGTGTFPVSPYNTGTTTTYAGNLGSGFRGRTVYWYVRGQNSNGTASGPWSQVYSFTLQD